MAILLALLILFAHFWSISSQSICLSCASPVLRTQWLATGLPQHPPISTVEPKTGETLKQFAFFDQCGEERGSGTTQIKFPQSECSGGMCIEMLLVVNNVYAIVRGCLSDFFPPEQTMPTTGNPGCIYAKVNQNSTIWQGGTPEYFGQTQIGAHLCQASQAAGAGICNDKLKINKAFARGQIGELQGGTGEKGWDPSADAGSCRSAQGNFKCLQCMRVDMEGTCNWDVRKYCNGPWCTKTIGYVNGRWLEVRGCAAINPMNTQSCSKIEQKTELSIIGESQIPQMMSVEQCFCANDLCNGANMLGIAGMASVLLTFLAISLFSIHYY